MACTSHNMIVLQAQNPSESDFVRLLMNTMEGTRKTRFIYLYFIILSVYFFSVFFELRFLQTDCRKANSFESGKKPF